MILVGRFLLEKPDEKAQSHPYFKDEDYVKRRMDILKISKGWKIGTVKIIISFIIFY